MVDYSGNQFRNVLETFFEMETGGYTLKNIGKYGKYFHLFFSQNFSNDIYFSKTLDQATVKMINKKISQN